VKALAKYPDTPLEHPMNDSTQPGIEAFGLRNRDINQFEME